MVRRLNDSLKNQKDYKKRSRSTMRCENFVLNKITKKTHTKPWHGYKDRRSTTEIHTDYKQEQKNHIKKENNRKTDAMWP